MDGEYGQIYQVRGWIEDAGSGCTHHFTVQVSTSGLPSQRRAPMFAGWQNWSFHTLIHIRQTAALDAYTQQPSSFYRHSGPIILLLHLCSNALDGHL